MYASFVESEQRDLEIRQLNTASVFQGDEGIGHLAHAVRDIDAGIAPENGDLDSGSTRWGGCTCGRFSDCEMGLGLNVGNGDRVIDAVGLAIAGVADALVTPMITGVLV
jgi:hypothetical protein